MTERSPLPRARAISVEDSAEMDIAAIASIYGHWVRDGLASFELDPPAGDEMRRRRASSVRDCYPRALGDGNRSPPAT
ncbi:MAG TPA: hypothetical protein VFW10_16580 [Steroidobacteraceae bacterium]|nr:hypothetical protein [Steroidobacteraceae bacterium]